MQRRAQAMKRRSVRRLAWVGVALCLVALALGVTVRLLEPPPGVTEANVRRIRLGMTLAEVEAVLGQPPDSCEAETEEVWSATWSGEEGDVDVTFDEKDRI